MQLIRRFSPLNLLLLSINGMIGSGWLFAPMYAAKIAGPATIIAWLLGGGATILIALAYAETSTLLPTAGGSTRIPQLSHGELVSFIMSWVSWLASVTMPAIEVLAVLQYSSNYFPSLTHTVNNAPMLTAYGFLWATILMAVMCILNVASFKGLVRVNQILFTFKIAVMMFTILFFTKTFFHSANFAYMAATPTSSIGWHAILTAVATGGVVFAFTGFKHTVELAGETKRSQVTIPLAIIGSVIGCLILYIGLEVAFIGALHPDALKNGWNALDFAGDAGPFVGIAGILGLAWLAKLLYVDAAVSPSGTALIYVTSTSRIVYALSENGYLPKLFARVNKQGLPMWAIAFNFVVGMFLFLPFPGWQTMVSFLVSAVVISYAMAPIAVLSLRRLVPEEKRPFRLPAANLLCFLAFYCCNLMSYWTGWDTMYKLAIALAIGLVLFLIACSRKAGAGSLGLKASLWIIPYLVGLVVISYLGSFGGKNIIPFGWDFLVIAIFSFVMLYLAVAVRLNKIPAQYEIYKSDLALS